MKQTERDIKYIIKRILIGVGIAIILFNLKKCNIYALSSSDYYFYGGDTNYTRSSLYQQTTKPSYYTELSSMEYDNSTIHIMNPSGYSSYATASINMLFLYNNTYYLYSTYYKQSGFDSIPNIDNISYLDISSSYPPNLLAKDSSGTTILNYTTSQGVYSPSWLPFYNSSYIIDFNNITSSKTYNGNKNTSVPLSVLTTDGTLVATNSSYTIKYGDKIIYENDPLESYTKIDLTGYQAVLLVPKDYQTMLSDSSHTNENPPGVFRTYLDLEYYSQECVRGTLINVENIQDIMLNNIGVGTGSLAESVTGTCYTEPTQTIMSYEFDQYSGLKARGLLIYNGTQDWQSGFGTETPFFGTSYVWYDSNLYNAYLVESFDNFNQTISYKDYSGEDQEVTIESLPTFTESMENAIENVDSPTPTEVNKQKIQAILNFLKTPFTFLNKLNTTSCSPIDLPFPRSNQTAHIECLSSSVYDRYLPNALKSIIVIIINGLLFYRCTLSNIDIFTNILDPEDNKLEAIQL